MTEAEALILAIDADNALADAEDFMRDIERLDANAPSDFTAEERAALDLLMAAAVDRVKIRRVAAGLGIKEKV